MSGGAFDDLTDVFDAIIDWPKRLAHEEGFYRRIFSRVDARRVVDVAGGTGRHAALFHSWGLDVEGADLSPNMIARARARFGEEPGLHWVVRGYDQPIDAGAPFDAAVCVGNSLALAPDVGVAHKAIGQMLAGIRPGGAVVVHVLNLWSLPDGPCVWQKTVRTNLPEGPALIVKGVHRCGDRGYIELLVSPLEREAPLHSECVPLLGLEPTVLENAMREGGASRVSIFGGYQDQAFDPHKSVDLVVVAEK